MLNSHLNGLHRIIKLALSDAEKRNKTTSQQRVANPSSLEPVYALRTTDLKRAEIFANSLQAQCLVKPSRSEDDQHHRHIRHLAEYTAPRIRFPLATSDEVSSVISSLKDLIFQQFHQCLAEIV